MALKTFIEAIRETMAEEMRRDPSVILLGEDVGLKGGLKLPSGLNAGQQIELLLDHIALPYYEIKDFDARPTPFRSIRRSSPARSPWLNRSVSP